MLYPIELPVNFEILGPKRISVRGRTRAISSTRLRIECERPLAAETKVQLSIAWPAALPNGTQLSLWIQGEVEGSVLDEISVRVLRYEFKTRRPVQSAHCSASGGSLGAGIRRTAGAGG